MNRDLVSILMGFVSAVIILLVGRWLAHLLSLYASRSMERVKMDSMVIRFLKNLVYTVVMVAVVIAALNSVGIHTTSLTALLASAGVAIGLGLKDSLSNLASGVMIMLFRPYTINHFVEAGGTSGLVEEVRMFNSILRTPDNVKVIVPNSTIINGTIKNFSAYETRRVDLVVRIRYEDSIKAAREILMRIMQTHPLVLPEPVPSVEVLDLAENSVQLAVRAWTKTSNNWQARCELLEQMKTRLDEAGFSAPAPRQEIRVYPFAGDGKELV
jgi:small conductance mechanosensitive channel